MCFCACSQNRGEPLKTFLRPGELQRYLIHHGQSLCFLPPESAVVLGVCNWCAFCCEGWCVCCLARLAPYC
jgi:hypothetical protein